MTGGGLEKSAFAFRFAPAPRVQSTICIDRASGPLWVMITFIQTRFPQQVIDACLFKDAGRDKKILLSITLPQRNQTPSWD
jgi:hypothetical protein